MSGVHAPIAPSSLDRTVECPGWVQLAAKCPPEEDTEEAREGEAAHWCAMEYAAHRSIPAGTKAPNGVELDGEMTAGALLWMRHCQPDDHFETPVAVPRIPECWGTPDRWRFDPEKYVLHVSDYKYGHLFVEVFENWQLMAYAAGLIDTLGLDDLRLKVALTIVQPRSYHVEGPVRTWLVDGAALRPYINQGFTAATEALGPNPTCHTGTHCAFCPARQSCRTLQLATQSILDWSGIAEHTLMAAADIGRELRHVAKALELLEARKTGLAAQAESLVKSGQAVPFWKLEQVTGKLAWNVTVDEVAALGFALEANLLKPPTPITPTQAINAGVDESVILQYASRPKGAFKLVPDDLTASRKVFGNNARKS